MNIAVGMFLLSLQNSQKKWFCNIHMWLIKYKSSFIIIINQFTDFQ